MDQVGTVRPLPVSAHSVPLIPWQSGIHHRNHYAFNLKTTLAGAFQKALAQDGRATADKVLEAYRILDDLASHIPNSAFPSYTEFESLLVKLNLLDGPLEKFAVIGVTSRYQRPFLTDNGHLDSSCELTEAGDEVWIISRILCPF